LPELKFADEIIVVLDRCTDNTRQVALSHGAKIIEGSFPIEGDRRMAAINAAQFPWCFEVDADEGVSPALAAEIKTTIINSTADYHLIPVDNYIGNHLVRYGWGASFGTTAVARLFRKGVKHWGNQSVHPVVKFTGTRGDMLKNPLLHKVDDTIADMVQRLNRYTDARAADIRAGRLPKGGQESLGRNIGRFFSRFYKCYVGRKGYREGNWGFLIALMAGLFPLLSYLKAKLEQPND
jgi:glycosyltransferase involved in cell wall biosynthesis